MKTIIKLAIKLFRRNFKRNLVMILGISITIFFVISIISVFSSYHDLFIENAYAYGGRWDLRINNKDVPSKDALLENQNITHVGQVQTVFSAQLDIIDESNKEGPSAAFATHWNMSLLGCSIDSFDMLQYPLQSGRWPEDENEIALPSSFTLDGKSVQNKEIKVGDKINLLVGKRVDVDGKITQAQQMSGPEQFTASSIREYVVCGIITDANRSSGVFVSSGVVYTSTFNENSMLLIQTSANSQAELDAISRAVGQKLSIPFEQIVENEYLTNAFLTIEQSDYLKSITYGGIIFIIGLTIICTGVILNNLLMMLHEARQKLGLLRMVGAGRAHISLLYFFQSLITATASAVLGVALSYAAIGVITKIIGAIKLSEFSKINIVIQPLVIVMTVLFSFIINCVLSLATVRSAINSAPVNSFQSGLHTRLNQAEKSMLIDLAGRLSESYAIALRGLARKKFRTTLTIIALIISLSVMTIGFAIGASLWQKSQRELRGFATDYYLIFFSAENKSEQLITDMPPVENLVKMYTGNRNVEIPNKYLNSVIVDFLRIGDQDLLQSMTICSIDESLYEDLDPDNQLMPFEEFVKSGGCLISNTALLNKEFAVLNSEGDLGSTEEAASTDDRYVSITTYAVGDQLKIYPAYDSDTSMMLPIQGVLSKAHVVPIDNMIETIVYVSEAVFSENFSKNSCRMLFIDAHPGQQDMIGQFLVDNKGKYDYFLQDNTLLAGSIKDNNTLQMMAILSVIFVIVLLCIISMFSIIRTDFLQRRRETAVARALGEDLAMALKIRFFEDLTVLMIAIICVVVFFVLLFQFIAQPVLDFYQLELNAIQFYFVVSSLIMLLIVFGHNSLSLAKSFGQKIIQDLAWYN